MEAAEIGTALLLDAGLAEIEEMLSSSLETKASFSAGMAKKREPPLITYAMFCFHHKEGPVKCDPTTVSRSPEKPTNCQHKTVGAKC